MIAYWTETPLPVTNCLHVYRVSDGRDHVVLRGYYGPGPTRFETPTLLSFVEEGCQKLGEVSLTGGPIRTLFSSTYCIFDFAWSPGRTAVAFIGSDPKSVAILVWHRGVGITLERRIGLAPGLCGRSVGDDEYIGWSPDGTRILVSDTILAENTATMFVVSHGKDVVTPRQGTEARWTSDGHSIIYMTRSSPYSWNLLDTNTGKERRLPIPEGDYAQISPDGTMMAYERPADLSVHVFTITTGRDRSVFSSAISPVWIDQNTLVVMKVHRCTGCDCGPPEALKELGFVLFRIGWPAKPFPVPIDASIVDISYS
jgi:WD40 repeat protein